MIISGRGHALLMLIVVTTGSLGSAVADPNEALVDALAGAFTSAQISALIASATGKVDPGTDQATQSLEQLQQLLGVSSDVVLALLRVLDRPDVRPEQLAQALAQSAIQWHTVMDRLAEITLADTAGQRLVTQAQAAMIAGHFSDTEALLRQLEDREVASSGRSPSGIAEPTPSTGQHLIRAAQALGVLGEIALMKLRFDEAADHFLKAAVLLPPNGLGDKLRFLTRRGDALTRRGTDYGDAAALLVAVEVYRDVLSQQPRDRAPQERAVTQNKLGMTLDALGEQETGTQRLEAAIAAYRGALEETTRKERPLDWAAIQSNLGDSLLRLGKRESGTPRLEEAVLAYRASLEERRRQRVPLDWAATQNKLGLALDSLGERGGVIAHLQEAAAAFHAALEERTRDRIPRDWAATQRNLGNVLFAIGQLEEGTAPLQEAVTAYRAALEVVTREEAPFQWGATQLDLASALFLLGRRTEDRGRLTDALGRFEQAKAAFEQAKLADLADGVSTVIALVQQRLALLPLAEPNSAGPQPAQPVDTQLPAETKPPLPLLDIGSPEQLRAVQPTPQADLDHPIASQDQGAAAIASNPTAANQLGAVTTAAPHGLPEQRTGLPSAGAVAKLPPAGLTLPADMLALLLRRGDVLLALGDVSSARLLYERAAAGGDGRAATGAGKTYDPLFLSEIGARGIQADPAAAAAWYRRAIELGDQSAAERLKRMSQGTNE